MARLVSAAHFEPVAWWYTREEIGRGLRECYGPASDLPPRLQLLVKELDKQIDLARQFVRTRFYFRDSGCEFALPFRVLIPTASA
jgi:hypothetical protein